jgi:predicted flap endonuclease-1-like 5' DNA nuclease
MGLYTRAQLAIILAIFTIAGLGLGVGHWRRTHPDLVARLERFDRAPTPFTPTVGDLPLATTRRPRPDPVAPRPEGAASRTVAPKTTTPVDVNRATEDELRTLPGVGSVLAARIIEARRESVFTSMDDLRRVRGLGRAKLARLAEALRLSP